MILSDFYHVFQWLQNTSFLLKFGNILQTYHRNRRTLVILSIRNAQNLAHAPQSLCEMSVKFLLNSTKKNTQKSYFDFIWKCIKIWHCFWSWNYGLILKTYLVILFSFVEWHMSSWPLLWCLFLYFRLAIFLPQSKCWLSSSLWPEGCICLLLSQFELILTKF